MLRHALALIVLAGLASAAASPIAAAIRADRSMACCRGGSKMACCAADGSCSIKACPAGIPAVEIPALPPAVVVSLARLPLPLKTNVGSNQSLSILPSPIPDLLDPPPRG